MTSLPATRVEPQHPSFSPHSLGVTSAAGRPKPGPRRPRPSAQGRRRTDEETCLRTLLAEHRGHLGSRTIDVNFNDLACRSFDKSGIFDLGDLIIDTRGTDLLIEQLDDERVLTGRSGHHIDCRILFRHAYGRMICRLGVDRLTSDTHIGLIESRSLKEVQSFSFSRPRHVGHDGGGSLWTHLEYRASPLNEIQGLAWRGGSLRLSSITLIP